MAVQVFEGWIDDVEANIMYVRLVDITRLKLNEHSDEYCEQLYAEIDTKFVARHDKKYIKEGSVFNIFIQPEGEGKEEKVLLRFKKRKPLTKEQRAEIERKAEELGKLLE